ncbi:MAG: tRNA 4-thiouridine(8) synthase ThiI, partial [Firmicutes bacterium]|nr:tRNA 4-thiouridine(8) synthase ThiI [Bacillota bacterium]
MNEQNILIVRCGEVALKGMNKPYFERMLVDRIKRNLKSFEGVDVRRHEGLIFVRAEKDLDIDAIVKQISKVFGVASISKAVEAPSELNAIGDEAVKYMMNLIEERGVKTFKVEGKRADKTFPVKSPDLGRIIGAKILVGCKVLKVDVHQPDVLLHVDVRSDRTYIYEGKIAGFGGLPLGTNGKGLTLLSGGIDSPVATW